MSKFGLDEGFVFNPQVAGSAPAQRRQARFGGFPGDSDGKESACDAGDLGLIPGLGRSPGEGNGYPLQ